MVLYGQSAGTRISFSGGGSVDISEYEANERVVGVLAVGYGGMFGGQAIAEILVGDVNPSNVWARE